MKPTLPERLRRYAEACVAERLDPDFAAAVREATASLEEKEPRSAGSETTVLLTPDAIFLLLALFLLLFLGWIFGLDLED